jgi:DNA-binding transcriptional regulator YdaS (Cro superfamily)
MIKKEKDELRKAFNGINRNDLAKQLGTSNRNLIDQIASGNTQVSAKRAKAIERITFGKIPAKVLRPDIFE